MKSETVKNSFKSDVQKMEIISNELDLLAKGPTNLFYWGDGKISLAEIYRHFVWSRRRSGGVKYPKLYYQGKTYVITDINVWSQDNFRLDLILIDSVSMTRMDVDKNAVLTKHGGLHYLPNDRADYTAYEFWQKYHGTNAIPRKFRFIGVDYRLKSMTWLSTDNTLLFVLEDRNIQIAIEMSDKYNSYVRNELGVWTVRGAANIPHEKVTSDEVD